MRARNIISTRRRTIDHPEKIGIGIWDQDGLMSARKTLESWKFAWHYTWGLNKLYNDGTVTETVPFIPMLWYGGDVTTANLNVAVATGAGILLGFNEPDISSQANMTVAEASSLWPQLVSTGLRLGSPAPTGNGALGANTWLGQFMALRGSTVDFICVHYYPSEPSITDFRNWLLGLYAQYGKPIWVTEWALVDFTNVPRYSMQQIADFAFQAIQMMDELDFVERHAWYSAYDGGGGFHINTYAWDTSNNVTVIGKVLADALRKQL